MRGGKYKKMKKPFQMYSKLGDLKIIQLKRGGTPQESPQGEGTPRQVTTGSIDPRAQSGIGAPIPFVGVINHKITSGLIITSKINRVRKDGMLIKYFKNNYVAAKDFGKIRGVRPLPLPLEYKFSGHPLFSKKFIKLEGSSPHLSPFPLPS
jgi:hypothetical protein